MEDVKQRIVTLSEHVATAFGRSDIPSDMFEDGVQLVVDGLRAKDSSRMVSLGVMIAMRVGLCRHRSILFKYLCDHMHRFPAQWGLTAAAASASASSADGIGVVRGAIPCQLVRGVQLAPGTSEADAENHMWNVVRLGDALFVVDVMQRPGQLLAADSKQAEAYQRAILAGATNGQSQVRTVLISMDALCLSMKC